MEYKAERLKQIFSNQFIKCQFGWYYAVKYSLILMYSSYLIYIIDKLGLGGLS